MIKIQKIISGGQTGVDQAALDVALTINIACGGWCPPGRACEDGVIPLQYPLKETPSEKSPHVPDIPRSQRTEWNVRDADGTLILRPANFSMDKGTEWTIQSAINYKKPYLEADPFDIVRACVKIRSWMEDSKIQVLNIAGPSERTCPGIGAGAFALLIKVFEE